ncbi:MULTISPECIES: hypothetical protein [unclassified Mycobacterium]|uniref:hypothetical protein n=1 Tax=unclassified Mycobacterium TaxID=2642494 RepID=UPI0029C7533F|nr:MULTISPECIES: hypothetical protein [unclassified Mycobacterium]
MTSRQKVASTLASYPATVTLHQTQWIRWAELVGAVVPFILGLYSACFDDAGALNTTTHGQQVGVGLALAAAAAFMIALAVRDLRRRRSLTLDTNGFRISSGSSRAEYPWSDVQNFREVGDGERFAVGFDLVSVAEESDAGADYYYLRLCHHYGLRGTDLLALVTQWHAKALGLTHPKRDSHTSAD